MILVLGIVLVVVIPPKTCQLGGRTILLLTRGSRTWVVSGPTLAWLGPAWSGLWISDLGGLWLGLARPGLACGSRTWVADGPTWPGLACGSLGWPVVPPGPVWTVGL